MCSLDAPPHKRVTNVTILKPEIFFFKDITFAENKSFFEATYLQGENNREDKTYELTDDIVFEPQPPLLKQKQDKQPPNQTSQLPQKLPNSVQPEIIQTHNLFSESDLPCDNQPSPVQSQTEPNLISANSNLCPSENLKIGKSTLSLPLQFYSRRKVDSAPKYVQESEPPAGGKEVVTDLLNLDVPIAI